MFAATLAPPVWHASPIVRAIVLGEESSEYVPWLKAVHTEGLEVILNPHHDMSIENLARYIGSHFDNAVVYLAEVDLTAPTLVRLGQLVETTEAGHKGWLRFGLLVLSHHLPRHLAGKGHSGLYHVCSGQMAHVWQGEGPNKPGYPVEPALF